MGVNSIRYNGLVHKKGIDVRPTKDNKGVMLIEKRKSMWTVSAVTIWYDDRILVGTSVQNNCYITDGAQTPAKSTITVTLKKNGRKTLKSVRNTAKHYRGSQVMVCTLIYIPENIIYVDILCFSWHNVVHRNYCAPWNRLHRVAVDTYESTRRKPSRLASNQHLGLIIVNTHQLLLMFRWPICG